MSSTTDFIAELIRAANAIEKLTHYEVSRLLDLSIDTIRDMCRQTGGAGIHSETFSLISGYRRSAPEICLRNKSGTLSSTQPTSSDP